MVVYLSIYIIKMCRGRKDICLVKMANMSKDLNSAGRLSWLAHFHLLGLITWCCSLKVGCQGPGNRMVGSSGWSNDSFDHQREPNLHISNYVVFGVVWEKSQSTIIQDKDGFALAVGANILCQRDHVCLDVFGIYS